MHKSWTGHALRALQASLLALSLVAMNFVPLTSAFAQDADPAPSEPSESVVEETAPPVIEDPEPSTDPLPEDGDIGDTGDTDTGDAGDGSADDEFGAEFKALFAPLIAPLTAEPDVIVYIYKYVDGANGEEPAASPAPSFPMHAVWNATNIGSGNGDYSLDAPSYSTQTTNMSAHADYATNEITNGSPVLAAGAECEAGKYRLVGYRYGDSLEEAEGADISTASPNFTDLTSDQYVIVVNEDCDSLPPPPTPQSCTLVSDGNDTYIGSDPASEITPHPVWTNAFSGDNAKWIWDEGSPDATVVFTRTFTSSNLNIGTLEIAADNSYSVLVNGDPVLCNGAGDNNFNSDIGTYGISGGPDSCTIPVLAGTNTITFTVTNAGGAANPDAGNPAGLYYRITVPDSSCSNVAPVQTSDVRLCKVSDDGEPLANWQLYLIKNFDTEGFQVPTDDPAGVDSDTLTDGVTYLLSSIGSWLNQDGANPADAEYSTTDDWETHMDGYDGYGAGILELEVNETDTGWGPYNDYHSYSQLFEGTGSPVNFRIFDGDTGSHEQNLGWFGDNKGFLQVYVDEEVYGGTTDDDGCITVTDVPFGDYTLYEVPQSGWYPSDFKDGEESVGPGVTVDEENETFTFVNTPIGSLTIVKHTTGGDGTFTFNVSELEDEEEKPVLDALISAHSLEDVASFAYEGEDEDYPLSFDVTTEGGTGSTGSIPLDGGTYDVTELVPDNWDLTDSYCEYDGNEAGISIDQGEQIYLGAGDEVTCHFYDNKTSEIDQVKVHIFKYLWVEEDEEEGYGEAVPVADGSGLPPFPMTSTWQAANLNGGVPSSGSYVLGNNHGGSSSQYGADTSPMDAPADYTTSETTDGTVVVASEEQCSPGKYVLLGYKSGNTLAQAEAAWIEETPPVYEDITSDRYIIVVNKPCGDDSGETPMCVITSDEVTLEGGESSFIASFIHASWTAIVEGAQWIWGDAAIVDPAGTETQTFTRGFSLDSVPVTGGTLVIAADNTYSVSVNGNLVASSADEDNYTDGAKDTINIPAAALIAGNNTLEITVTNLALEGGTQETNPAGLKYRLTIDGSNCEDVDPSFKVHIFKYLMDDESASQVPNDSDAPLFPMIALYDIEGVGANLDPGEGYDLGDGGGVGGSDDGLLWAANTISLHSGDTYGTYEVTGGDSPVVKGEEACSPGKYFLVGYKTGDTLAEAQAAGIVPDEPYYESIDSSKYVIVVNEECDDDGGGDDGDDGSLTIIKNTVGGDGTFNFNVDPQDEGEEGFGFSLTTTEEGHTDSETFPLDEGWYDVSEFVPLGWNLSIYCEYEGNEAGIPFPPQGESVYVEEGENVTCTFTNSVSGGEGSGTLHVVKVVDGGDGIPTDFSFQVNGGEPIQFEGDGQNDLSVVAGAYSVTELEAVGYSAEYSEGCSGTMPVEGDITCTIINGATSNGGGGSSGGGGGGSNNNNNDGDGEVLGATTDGEVLGNECTLLTDFMREGLANNPAQVTLLQEFLNGEMGVDLPLSGFFGSLTTEAVNSFQLKYWEEVLKPWADINLGEEHTPTGYVYKTTLWKINDIKCPDLDVPFPTLP